MKNKGIILFSVLCLILLSGCGKKASMQEIFPADTSVHIPLAPIFVYQDDYYGIASFGNEEIKRIPVDAVLFCIYGDAIYYIPSSEGEEPSGLWKTNLEGKIPEKITDHVSALGSPVIVDGKIISSSFGMDGQEAGVFITDLTTRQSEKISDIPWVICGYEDDWIYYRFAGNEALSGVFRAKMDGSQEMCVYAPQNTVLLNPVVYHNCLYFSQQRGEASYDIFCFDIAEEKTETVLQNISDSRFDIAENILYYADHQEVLLYDLTNGSKKRAETVFGEKTETARLLILKDQIYWIDEIS